MMNICIKYSYDGSKFNGFQRQNNLKTVQGKIEEVFLKSFNEKINLVSSGRTDFGVHAIEQVSNFILKNEKLSLKYIMNKLNEKLLGEILIHSIDKVEDSFNSRYSVKKRWYMYKLSTKNNLNPFNYMYISEIKDDIDVDKFNEIAKVLLGKHNFSSFMKVNKDVKNYEREIYDIYMEKKDNLYYFYIAGSAFLHSMVRIILGSLLAVYFKEVDKDYITYKLNNLEPDKPKKILSPNGLYLYKVEY